MDQTAARFRSIVQNASDVVTILRADSTVDYASPAAEQVWAVSPAALQGTQILGRVHPDDLPAARAHLAETIKQPATNIATELRIQHGDDHGGFCRRRQQYAQSGYRRGHRDDVQRHHREQAVRDQLKHLAFHDPLAGLPNRALFTIGSIELAHADRDRSVGLLFLDVDNFKWSTTASDISGARAARGGGAAHSQRRPRLGHRRSTGWRRVHRPVGGRLQ
jgi:predicted signal transduction protein with EAL and GGDEF domain